MAVTGGSGVRGFGVGRWLQSWSVVPLWLCGSRRACDQGLYIVGLHRIELCCFSPFVGLMLGVAMSWLLQVSYGGEIV